MSEQIPIPGLDRLKEHYNHDPSQPMSLLKHATRVVESVEAREGEFLGRRRSPLPISPDGEIAVDDSARMIMVGANTFIFAFLLGMGTTEHPLAAVFIGAGTAIAVTGTGIWQLFK